MKRMEYVASMAVLKLFVVGGIVTLPLGDHAVAQAQAQAQNQVLDAIDVQSQRRPQRARRRTEPAPIAQRETQPQPAPQAQTQRESAYGPVQGYLATRSATGTKTDTPLQEVPQAISVVTSDQMRDQGVTTVQEALRYVPGSVADAYGPDTRGDGPLVRGTTPVTYLDGMRLINGGYWNQYRPDPYTLSRVEVLRGPGSVLYGDSPAGGLINLVSKRPQEKDQHELGVQYGSFNRIRGRPI